MNRVPVNIIYTFDVCKANAIKCKTRSQFRKEFRQCYYKALKKKWIEQFNWLIDDITTGAYHNVPIKYKFEKCYEIAKQFKSKKDFKKAYGNMYQACINKKWIEKFTWLIDNSFNIKTDKIYAIYKYEFHTAFGNQIYIGLTVDLKRRDYQHRNDPSSQSAVRKNAIFLYENKYTNIIDIPKMEILEQNLTQVDACDKEHFYIEKYRNDGWILLNKAKTGIGLSSTGTLNINNWSKEKIKQEALKYKTKKDFYTNSPTAYSKALTKGYLKDFDWFEDISLPKEYKYRVQILDLHNNILVENILITDAILWMKDKQYVQNHIKRKRIIPSIIMVLNGNKDSTYKLKFRQIIDGKIIIPPPVKKLTLKERLGEERYNKLQEQKSKNSLGEKNPSFGKKWMFNPNTNDRVYCKQDNIQKYLELGYIFGNGKSFKRT